MRMRKGDPGNPNLNLPPTIMVQWKMAVSPILVSLHWISFPLNPWIDGRKSKPSFSDGNPGCILAAGTENLIPKFCFDFQDFAFFVGGTNDARGSLKPKDDHVGCCLCVYVRKVMVSSGYIDTPCNWNLITSKLNLIFQWSMFSLCFLRGMQSRRHVAVNKIDLDKNKMT